MSKLYLGRPVNCEGREPREIRVYDLLDRLDMEYYSTDHEPVLNMEDCKAIDEILGAEMCKNVFLCNRQMTDFYLYMMPGNKKFVTKDVSKLLGVSRLSFGPEDKLLEYLDMLPGSISVLGLMNDKENKVKLVIDMDVLDDDYIGVHPCMNTSSLKINRDQLLNVFLKEVHHDFIII